MKSGIFFVVIAIVAVVGVSVFKSSQNKEPEVMNPQEEKLVEDMMTNSRYVTNSQSALASTASGRRVLFFFASWCPTCKPADASFAKNESQIPDDVTIIRVNYNDPETDQEEKDLALKYGVTYQHTFVQIDSEGNEVTKWNGGQIKELLAKIK